MSVSMACCSLKPIFDSNGKAGRTKSKDQTLGWNSFSQESGPGIWVLEWPTSELFRSSIQAVLEAFTLFTCALQHWSEQWERPDTALQDRVQTTGTYWNWNCGEALAALARLRLVKCVSITRVVPHHMHRIMERLFLQGFNGCMNLIVLLDASNFLADAAVGLLVAAESRVQRWEEGRHELGFARDDVTHLKMSNLRNPPATSQNLQPFALQNLQPLHHFTSRFPESKMGDILHGILPNPPVDPPGFQPCLHQGLCGLDCPSPVLGSPPWPRARDVPERPRLMGRGLEKPLENAPYMGGNMGK